MGAAQEGRVQPTALKHSGADGHGTAIALSDRMAYDCFGDLIYFMASSIFGPHRAYSLNSTVSLTSGLCGHERNS